MPFRVKGQREKGKRTQDLALILALRLTISESNILSTLACKANAASGILGYLSSVAPSVSGVIGNTRCYSGLRLC